MASADLLTLSTFDHVSGQGTTNMQRKPIIG
jgi:hypothetical protein